MRIFEFPLTVKLIGCALLLTFVASTQAQTAPPRARVGDVTDEYFGVRVTDPYRWMEDLQSDELQRWMKAQADYGSGYLEKLPMRDEIYKRLMEVSSATTTVNSIQPRGNLFFYLRRAPDEQHFKLYVREGLTGAERLLVDPEKVKTDGKRYSFGNFNASHNGKYVSYNIAAGGEENGEIRLVEVSTGRDLGESVDRVRINSGVWLADNKSLLYTRLQKLPADAPQSERYQKRRVYLHRLGTNPDEDKPVFGHGINPDINIEPTYSTFASTQPGWKYVLAGVASVAPNREFYIAPVDALGQTVVPWRKIASFDDEVSSIDIHGDRLYLQTFKNAPRYKVVRTSALKPDLKTAETVYSDGEAILQSFVIQRDALYVNTLDGGNYRLHRVDYKTLKSAPLNLPYEGAATIGGGEFGTDGIYFNLVSWIKPRAHFRYDPKTGKATPTNLIPPHPVDMSHIEFTNAKAPSHDGVMIPFVIVHKKGLKRDGSNPTLMDGYGSYGVENISPFFDTNSLPWVERGGILVWTGIRGGGEYGEEWHKAGFQKTKSNTWKDFIAIADYLIREKYTSPKKIGIRGASAGGILIGNSVVERPDLFGAAVFGVGFNNPLRSEFTANGPGNAPEFGTLKTEEGFRALLGMDPYLKIKDGVKYPSVLLTHGVNDSRVPVWMSAKMAARLQAASISGEPILLRIDYDTGHGAGSTKEQFNKQLADEYAFLYQQLRARE